MGISGVARYFFMSAPAATAHADICIPGETIDGRLVHDLSLRCAQCARIPARGGRGPGTTVEPWASSRPSVEPWEPRAVSDPRMIASEFPKLTLHLVGMSRRGRPIWAAATLR